MKKKIKKRENKDNGKEISACGKKKKIKTREIENRDNGKENRLSVRGHPLNGAGPPKSPGSRTPPHRKL